MLILDELGRQEEEEATKGSQSSAISHSRSPSHAPAVSATGSIKGGSDEGRGRGGANLGEAGSLRYGVDPSGSEARRFSGATLEEEEEEEEEGGLPCASRK
jgi:hypothetical protein